MAYFYRQDGLRHCLQIDRFNRRLYERLPGKSLPDGFMKRMADFWPEIMRWPN
jgi:hypothetical protein